MRFFTYLTLAVICAVPALADRTKVDINTETPEGQLLQEIGTTEDAAQKRTLMEQFLQKHPDHPGALWVRGQLQPVYLEAGEHDKAIEIAEKLLEADPTDAEMAHGALKAAEAKNDPDLVIKWAVATSEAARKMVAKPKPEDEDEVEFWERRVDYAKQVDVYCEYSLFNTALQTQDPAKRIALADALRERNAESQYVPQIEPLLFAAYRQAGENDKALELAERTIEKDQTNEDMLLFAATTYFDKKEYDKSLGYAGKAVDAIEEKPAPEGVSAGDWEARRKQVIGSGLWLQGMIFAGQRKYVDTDRVLREALPHLEGNNQMLGPALFNLGLANYQLGQKNTKLIVEALRFNQQCAQIPGPYQAQARKNVAAIQSQYRGIK
jgi:tetratricopeptide (TPR) repeat protein